MFFKLAEKEIHADFPQSRHLPCRPRRYRANEARSQVRGRVTRVWRRLARRQSLMEGKLRRQPALTRSPGLPGAPVRNIFPRRWGMWPKLPTWWNTAAITRLGGFPFPDLRCRAKVARQACPPDYFSKASFLPPFFMKQNFRYPRGPRQLHAVQRHPYKSHTWVMMESAHLSSHTA